VEPDEARPFAWDEARPFAWDNPDDSQSKSIWEGDEERSREAGVETINFKVAGGYVAGQDGSRASTLASSNPLDAALAVRDAKRRRRHPRVFTGQHARRACTWPAIRCAGAALPGIPSYAACQNLLYSQKNRSEFANRSKIRSSYS
jgi:hypothetical protein